MHSHRLSLAAGSEDSEEELDEHEKPYEAPTMRIFGLNKPEWPFNLVGNYGPHSPYSSGLELLVVILSYSIYFPRLSGCDSRRSLFPSVRSTLR